MDNKAGLELIQVMARLLLGTQVINWNRDDLIEENLKISSWPLLTKR